MQSANLPTFDTMMLPLLRSLQALGGSASIEELDAKVVERMHITDEMMEVSSKSRPGFPEISYRLTWTRSYLKKYGILDNSSRGVWAFASDFDGDIEALSPQEIIRTVRKMRVDKTKKAADAAVEADAREGLAEGDETALPDQPLDWRDHLREVLLAMHPNAFERLALRLLRESGFPFVEVTGRTGDNGVDGKGIFRYGGIISFHVIFQCKRYRHSVSASEMRDFRGAMQGRTDKGLFITTGTFTSAAQREATREGVPAIDLVDGDALVEKLRLLGLGVREKIIIDYEVDEG